MPLAPGLLGVAKRPSVHNGRGGKLRKVYPALLLEVPANVTYMTPA